MATPANTSLLLAKFRRNARDYGVHVALLKSIKFFFGFIYEKNRYRIYEIDFTRSERRPPKQDGFAYKLVQPGDVDIIRQIEGMEEWLSGRIVDVLERGGVCIAAMDDGKVAGFNLVSFGEIYMPLVKKSRTFRKSEAWSEQITVNRNYRGKNLGTTLRLRIFDELRERGIRKFYGGTLPDNKANLSLTRKVGFRELYDIEYRKLLTMKRWRYHRIRPSATEKP